MSLEPRHDMTLLLIGRRIGYGLAKLPWLDYLQWVRGLPVREPSR